MDLFVGVFNQSLQVFLIKNNIQTWAMITAYNPGSRIRTETENKLMDRQLEQLLDEERFRFHAAEHRDPKGVWPAEKSFFIENIDLQSALTMARQFGQNAIVAGGREAVPQLFDCNQSTKRRFNS